MRYILLMVLFSFSPLFSQTPIMMNNNNNSEIMLVVHSKDKNGTKDKKSGLNFWFFSEKPKRSRSSRNYMKLFDSHAIFDFDKEIALAVSNSAMARETFKRESRLLSAQIEYYEEELIILLDEQLKGNDQSENILETYNTLYELSYKNFSMMNNHTQDITKIFQDTFDAYDIKIREKIKTATTNKTILIDELTTRYNTFISN